MEESSNGRENSSASELIQEPEVIQAS